MHLRDLMALPVGLMLFFSFLFQRMRAAPPVLPRLARHAGDHEARPSRVAVECRAVGIDEVRNPRAASCIRTAQCRFSAPGTARIQVAPSGSVGIGTANPGSMLTLYNTSGDTIALAGGSLGNGISTISTSSTGALTIASPGSVVLNTSAGNSMVFQIGGTERARILTTSGYFGIGTASPSDLLDVNGAIGLTTTTATLPVNGMYSPSANALSLTASGIQALTVSTTGYVGVSLYGPERRRVQLGAALARRRRVPATRGRRPNGHQDSRNTAGARASAPVLGDCFEVYPRQRRKELRAFLLLR
jgi:hypothetical protein